MDQQNKPQIPTLKESSGKPQLKIKGLAAGASLLERLKQFKKKDLAFIFAGLGVLFMAPLAEYFLMSPDDQTGAFKQGWGFREGGEFGKGGSPYDPGVNGMAPGGLAGGGSDVITPLNVRDPSALVMGPGQSQQPPTQAPAASAPPPPAPSKDSGGWNEVLKDAAAGAGKQAVKKASLPVPKVPLSAGGLRGLGAAQGGSGSSFGLAPIKAEGPSRAAQSNSLSNVRPTQGFKGVSNARGPGSGAGGLEALKKAADSAGRDFNRGGAGSSAEAAAGREFGGGASDGGASSNAGKEDKPSSASSLKDSKSASESLDFLRAKAIQDKEIDLMFKKREEEEMRLPKLYTKVLEELVMTPIKELAKVPGSLVNSLTSGAASGGTYYECEGTKVPAANIVTSCKDQDDTKWRNDGAVPGGYKLMRCGSTTAVVCQMRSGSAETTSTTSSEDIVDGVGGTRLRNPTEAERRQIALDEAGLVELPRPNANALGDVCPQIQAQAQIAVPDAPVAPTGTDEVGVRSIANDHAAVVQERTFSGQLYTAAQKIAGGEARLTGETRNAIACGVTTDVAEGGVNKQLGDARAELQKLRRRLESANSKATGALSDAKADVIKGMDALIALADGEEDSEDFDVAATGFKAELDGSLMIHDPSKEKINGALAAASGELSHADWGEAITVPRGKAADLHTKIQAGLTAAGAEIRAGGGTVSMPFRWLPANDAVKPTYEAWRETAKGEYQKLLDTHAKYQEDLDNQKAALVTMLAAKEGDHVKKLVSEASKAISDGPTAVDVYYRTGSESVTQIIVTGHDQLKAIEDGTVAAGGETDDKKVSAKNVAKLTKLKADWAGVSDADNATTANTGGHLTRIRNTFGDPASTQLNSVRLKLRGPSRVAQPQPQPQTR